MNLPYGLVTELLYWLANVVYALLLGWAVFSAPWRALKADSRRLHVFLGSTVFLLVIWQMNAGLEPGLSYHLLGGTLFMLMFGWQLAFVGVSLVLFGSTLNGAADFEALGLNGLLMIAVPVFFSYGVLRFAVRFLPHHFFVYIMANGFFTGGISMLLTVGMASLIMVCCSGYTYDMLRYSYLPFAPLIMFAEAFFTGMLAASMALFRPEWIVTFDDRRYLAGK